MLTKEYRIPLPMTIEEYRIAQLYMIQKKSRLESTGSGSAVEIIENVPYSNGPGGNGQYTKKIYHVGSHLPGWLKSLLPKTALRVEEEAWNAYPYTKTRHTCPFIEKFFIDIETHYLEDYGETENVFKLSKNERRNVEIDFINPIKDSFPQKDYKKEEDPQYFISKKTGRGPLKDNWLDKYKNGEIKQPIMCAYKLIGVEFKYWGMQTKIEQFIQNGLRNPILVGHRQAWSWQDEWFGLTIEDIRELERQTQVELSKRMDRLNNGDDLSSNMDSIGKCDENKHSDDNHSECTNNSELSSNHQTETRIQKSRSSVDRQSIAQQERLLEIHMKHIEQSESDDDDDDELVFFDALETLDSDCRRQQKSISSEDTISAELLDDQAAYSSSSLRASKIFADNKTKTIIFVVQGGSICATKSEYEAGQKDFQTFEKVFTDQCNNCYPGTRPGIIFELVQCPSLSANILNKLKELNVTSNKATQENVNMNEQLSNSFPFGSIPLLVTQAPNFQMTVDDLVTRINEKYREYVEKMKTEGMQINVYILADSLGGLLVYEAISEHNNNNDDLMSISSDNGSSISIDSDMFSIDDVSNSFEFVVNGLFSFGSPIGLVAFKQKLNSGKVTTHPQCGQMYNLFLPFDPMSSRLEPIIDKSFGNICPAPVPRYQAFPFNNDIQYNYCVLYEEINNSNNDGMENELGNSLKLNAERKISSSSLSSNYGTASCKKKSLGTSWWGTKRIDYMLHCPEGLQQFPVSSLLHLCYNSYWESKDLVTFILWQIIDEDLVVTKQENVHEIHGFMDFQAKEKWLKKKTKLKIKNMKPNHRANDVISKYGSQQFIAGRFTYGPVDLASLTGEKVDIYIATRPQLSDWKLLGTGKTDTHGRLLYTAPAKDLQPGVYSLQLVVRGDHSFVECNMSILPPQTDAVVFSIDGSFLASYSLRGIDPKIRGGAVDVDWEFRLVFPCGGASLEANLKPTGECRPEFPSLHWQELGYLIIYVSSRLLYQKGQVMSWLSQHNFPFGMVSFCESLSTDFHKHKTAFLKGLTNYEQVNIHAAYGSSRDIPVYNSELRLPPAKVFLIGKKPKSKKADSAQWIMDGYASHLTRLKESSLTRRSASNKNMFLTLGNFGISYEKNKLSPVKSNEGGGSHDKSTSNEDLDKTLQTHKPRHGHSFIKSFRHKTKHDKNRNVTEKANP